MFILVGRPSRGVPWSPAIVYMCTGALYKMFRVIAHTYVYSLSTQITDEQHNNKHLAWPFLHARGGGLPRTVRLPPPHLAHLHHHHHHQLTTTARRSFAYASQANARSDRDRARARSRRDRERARAETVWTIICRREFGLQFSLAASISKLTSVRLHPSPTESQSATQVPREYEAKVSVVLYRLTPYAQPHHRKISGCIC